MRSPRSALAVGLALLAGAGCSAVVDGSGRTTVTPDRARPTHDFPTAGATPSRSSGTAVPGRFARSPAATAIGDPPTIDLCSVVDAKAFRRPGYAAQLAKEQYPPGCEVDMSGSDDSTVTVEAYATPQSPDAAAGRVSRRVGGQLVYSYPYSTDHGECARAIAARRVTIMVDAYTDGLKAGAKPSRSVNCASADRMVFQLATGMSNRALTRLALAAPSITSLDACSVARAAGWPSVPVFSGMPLAPDAFGAGCGFDSDEVGVSVDPVIAEEDRVADASAISVAGHRVYAFDDNDPTECEFVSIQGTTADGHHEAVDVDAHDARRTAGFCAQVTAAFGRYLSVAGLR